MKLLALSLDGLCVACWLEDNAAILELGNDKVDPRRRCDCVPAVQSGEGRKARDRCC